MITGSMLKFRAFDVNQSKMIPVARLNFGDDGSSLTVTVEIPGKYHRSIVHGENCVVMQFSGLYDKNKREIYEGDILSKRIRNGKCYSVLFGNFSFSDGDLYEEVCFDSVGWFGIGKDDEDIILCEDFSEYVIVGNIYENPELLKHIKGNKSV